MYGGRNPPFHPPPPNKANAPDKGAMALGRHGTREKVAQAGARQRQRVCPNVDRAHEQRLNGARDGAGNGERGRNARPVGLFLGLCVYLGARGRGL